MSEPKRIVLGSGKLYVMPFTTAAALPTNEEIEVADNLIGYIQGGATLEYKPTYYEAKDDKGYVSKVILTAEDATLKSGVMTWNGDTLGKLSDTARVTLSADGKTRTVKIGGAGNQKGAKYIIHFLHEDAADGNIRVRIVGNNQAGFTLSFLKDKETVIDAEFKASPQDDEGTLISYEEDILDDSAASTPDSGGGSGTPTE